MNLWCDDKTAKVDYWLTGCGRHCAPSLRYAERMIGDTPVEQDHAQTFYLRCLWCLKSLRMYNSQKILHPH